LRLGRGLLLVTGEQLAQIADGSLFDTSGWTRHTVSDVLPLLARFLAAHDA
jgi:hypothetical protein